MINEMDDLIENFRGQRGHVRCFDHILNLVVKMLLKQFDISPHCAKCENDTDLDATEATLQELARELEMEIEEDNDDVAEWDLDTVDLDDVEGWVDKRDGMSVEEAAKHEATMCPVKLVLAKVC